MPAPYPDDDDPRDRVPMLCTCFGLHSAFAGGLAFFLWRSGSPVRLELAYSGNAPWLSLLVLASASCTISLILCLALTSPRVSHWQRSTRWLLGLCVIPALFVLLATVLFTST